MKKGIYKEDGWIAKVEIIGDNSDNEWEIYKLRVIKSLKKGLFENLPDNKEFSVCRNKKYINYCYSLKII
jgi:hypothetical protein